jgi:hypothetical protein
MLPSDVKAHKEAVKTANREEQGTLDPHLQEIPRAERTIPYSEKIFRDAAIEWLISTDQVLCLCPLLEN